MWSLDRQNERKFTPGEKVIYLPERKIYDFGYSIRKERAVIYEVGERNMQDGYVVDVGLLEKINSLGGKNGF